MRTRTILPLAAIAMPLMLAGCTDPSGQVNTVYGNAQWSTGELAAVPYERGKKHFAEGQFGVAVRDFEEALLRDPRSVETLNALAASYDRVGRFDLSERYYLRALSLDPNSVQSLNNLGFSYLMQRRYDLAMTYLRDAKRVEPDNSFVAQNIQKAEAATDLIGSDFKAAPVETGWFEHYAGSAPRARTDEAVAVAVAPRDGESDEVVNIVVYGTSPSPWIERTRPEVQSLVTEPSPEIDLAAREWGVKPALANYRPRSALEAAAERRIPWDVIEKPGTTEAFKTPSADLLTGLAPSASVIAAPRIAVEQVALAPVTLAPADEIVADEITADHVVADEVLAVEAASADLLTDAPPAVSAGAVTASRIEVEQLASAPANHVTADEVVADQGAADQSVGVLTGPMSLLPDMALLPPVDPASPDPSPTNLVPEALLETDDPAPAATGPIALLPADFAVIEEVAADPLFVTERMIDQALPLVEVSNGTGREHMASRVGGFLEDRGFPNLRVTNAEHFGFMETTIYYRDGWLDQAQRLTAEFPATMLLEAAPDQAVDIRVRLGGDLLIFDRELLHADRNPTDASAG